MTADLFSAGGYTNIPNAYLTPDFIRQVGLEGLGLIVVFIKAFDNAAHYRGASGGRFRITDKLLGEWCGKKSSSVIRRIRRRILNATPGFFINRLQGITKRAYEYVIRRTTEADKVSPQVWKAFTGSRATNLSERGRYADGHIATSRLNSALTYVAQGRGVIPLRPHGKKASIRWKQYQQQRASQAEVQRWFAEKFTDANVGIVTGAISDLVVVDIDGDLAAAKQLLADHGIEMPPTTTVKTANGWHFWFKHPHRPISSSARVLENDRVAIDVRADGGYVVAPPSVHESGIRYTFDSEHTVADMPLTLVEFLTSRTSTSIGQVSETGAMDADVAAVLASVDIVKVIEGAGVELKSCGTDALSGRCPFHDDEDPSFAVTPSKGLWCCFACSIGGNVIHFLMRLNSWTKGQALGALRSTALAA